MEISCVSKFLKFKSRNKIFITCYLKFQFYSVQWVHTSARDITFKIKVALYYKNKYFVSDIYNLFFEIPAWRRERDKQRCYT